MSTLNIEAFVAFAEPILGRLSITRTYVNFRCPFHQDRTASAGMSIRNPKFTCFSCGSDRNQSLPRFIENIVPPGRFNGLMEVIRFCNAELVSGSDAYEPPEAVEEVLDLPEEAIPCFDPATGKLRAPRTIGKWRTYDRITKEQIILSKCHYAVEGKYAGYFFFPIYTRGVFDGWQARVFEAQDGKRRKRAKWLTPAGYKTGQRLYNIDNVPRRAEIGLILEGIFHVKAAERAGIPAVSAFGCNSLTAAQIELLNGRRVKEWCLIHDADKRGKTPLYAAALVGKLGQSVMSYAFTPDARDIGEREPWEIKDILAERVVLEEPSALVLDELNRLIGFKL